MLLRLAPALFVLLWSTGWITARAVSPYADPLSFLTLRFALAAALLAALLAALGRAVPMDRRLWAHGVASGALLHALYLGPVWWAIDEGLPTPISGLIAALQPLMTATLAAGLIGERLGAGQWLGLGLGLGGLLLGLAPALAALEAGPATAAIAAVNALGMVAVTLGTLYQKRFLSGTDLLAVALTQYVGATLVALPAALLLEDLRIVWTPVSALAMAWSVFGLSFGAIGLLLLLIRHGEVSRAASLIYLIPAVVAAQAWALFSEALSPLQLVGLGVAAIGVYLVNRPARPAAATVR